SVPTVASVLTRALGPCTGSDPGHGPSARVRTLATVGTLITRAKLAADPPHVDCLTLVLEDGAPFAVASTGPCSMRTRPTNRMPLRGSGLMRRCSSPLSASAPRSIDARGLRRLGDNSSVPNRAQQIVSADYGGSG